MEIRFIIVMVGILLLPTKGITQDPLSAEYLHSLKYKHDLNLPKWGPYTKKYIGLSHVPDVKKGIRFDVSIFPGYYHGKTVAPNVFYETGFHPWEASPNLEYFSFRHELEWKDKVYTDISYSEIDSSSRAFHIECVNNSELGQSMVMHLMSSIHFPSSAAYQPDDPIVYDIIDLPEDGKWIDALEYSAFNYAKPSPFERLVTDGYFRGEIRSNGYVKGSGIRFGENMGDEVIYDFEVSDELTDPVLCIRYNSGKSGNAKIKLAGIVDVSTTLDASQDFTMKVVPHLHLRKGKNRLEIISEDGEVINIDGFAIVSQSDFGVIKIAPVDWIYTPEIIAGPMENTIILKYPQVETYYGIFWDYPHFQNREWYFKDLSDEFSRMANGHVKTVFSNGTDGHYFNVFMRPINLQPHATRSIYGMVCTGSLGEVKTLLKDVAISGLKKAEQSARSKLTDYHITPAGEKYLFGQKRMAATTITNIVYPVYTQNQYIRHHAPGRWWDCLYTWDAGFIGIGLSQMDIRRGVENLNAYLNEPDEESVFIHHGTPLPVQHYLFLELWNKTQSKELVKYFYPKLKAYYEFIAGKTETSNTANMQSGLIRTWDYFYNSGGWDDYPPQKYVNEHKLTSNVTPVVSSAHAIRIAKILKLAAHELGLQTDMAIYDSDIQHLSNALNNFSWDESSGYFGYVVHDTSGNVRDILKYDDQVNYNMGLGGASPLISGICTEDQKKAILSHLMTKGEIWSDVGLSAVDQSAPYYSNEGYWNGTVWMPHEWFYWKTMLDLGEANFADRIAMTALDTWKRETEDRYNCYEHFIIETGRGAGWHQFSGLSCPVLSWFNAYFQEGTITTGFDVWIKEKTFNESNTGLRANLYIGENSNSQFTVIVCLNPQYDYQVVWQGKMVEYKEVSKGTLSITLPNNTDNGLLEITKD